MIVLSSAWWKDPQWLGIGVAVAGIIVSVLIAVFPKLRKKKAVKIDVSQTYFWHNEEPNVVEVDQSKKQSKGRSISLKQVATINNRSSQDVTYKSTERFLIVLRILNIGNEPIQDKEYGRSIIFNFGNVEVLNINIPEQPGPRPVIEDNLGKGKIQLKPFTLGGRESVVLLIQLAERINNDIIIDTHIPTVKKFPTKVPIHTRPRVHLFSRREMIIGVLSLAAGSLGLALFDKYLLPPPPPSLMATPTATLQPTNRLQYIYHGHSRGVFSVRWSHSGKYIASTGLDQTIQVWDLTGKTLLNNSLYGTGEAVTWSPDDMYVATVDDFDGGQVHIFDLKVGRSIYAYPQANQLRSVEWSPDGKYLAFAGIDGNVYALDVTDLKRISLINTYKGHKNAVNSISWSPDSRYIASGSKDTTIQIWGAIDGSYISIYTMHSSEVFTVAWSADGQYIASGDRSGVLNVWDTPLAHPKTILSQTFSGLQGHTCAHAVSWSSDSHYVAFGSWNKTVIAFRLKDLFPFPPYESQRGAIGAVAWQPKSYLIATASSDDSDTTVQIWQGVQ